jgi:hypothetical protein
MHEPRTIFHTSMRSHPIVGFGLSHTVERASDGKWVTPWEAWVWLNQVPGVRQVIPGISPEAVQSLDILGDRIPEDVARSWNWKPRFAHKWFDDLASYSLVTDPLLVALHDCVRGASTRRKSALPSGSRKAVLRKTGGKCVYCGVSLSVAAGLANSYHADHVLPVAKGGSDDIGNLVPSCATCNAKKKAKTALDFMTGGGQ